MRWGRLGSGAVVAAAVLSTASAVVAPFVRKLELRGVWLQSSGELWLLMVFTEGALAVLLGLSVLAGWWRRLRGPSVSVEGGVWAILTGVLLLAVYGCGALWRG